VLRNDTVPPGRSPLNYFSLPVVRFFDCALVTQDFSMQVTFVAMVTDIVSNY
jgi:hypothetical protein